MKKVQTQQDDINTLMKQLELENGYIFDPTEESEVYEDQEKWHHVVNLK